MYNIIYEMSCQSRFDARYWLLGLVHWDELEGWDGEGVGGGHYYHTSKLHVYALIYCIGVFLSGLLHSVQ